MKNSFKYSFKDTSLRSCFDLVTYRGIHKLYDKVLSFERFCFPLIILKVFGANGEEWAVVAESRWEDVK